MLSGLYHDSDLVAKKKIFNSSETFLVIIGGMDSSTA